VISTYTRKEEKKAMWF